MWTVYIVTDTGREVPHWTAPTREGARKAAVEVRSLRCGLRTRIRKAVAS